MAAERITDAAGNVISKRCTDCGEMKPLREFREYKGRSKDGHYGCCIECHRIADNRRYAARVARRKQ